MKVYEDLVAGGFVEKLNQNINGFNAASNGAIVLRSEDKTGDFAREAFWKLVPGVSRRNDQSNAAQDPKTLEQDEDITVKLKYKGDQFEMTEDAFFGSGRRPDEFLFVRGQQLADQVVQYQLNRTIAAIAAAIEGLGVDANLDVSGDGNGNTLSPQNLNRVLAKYGDQQSRIAVWVMAGSGMNALAASMMGTNASYNDSGISIYNGGVPTLGRPVLAIDTDTTFIPAAGGDPAKFRVMGLVQGAGMCFQSEPMRAIFERKGGKENIVISHQAESAINLGVKGHKWDTGSGGRNPNDAAITTSANWIDVMTSFRDGPGIQLITQQ